MNAGEQKIDFFFFLLQLIAFLCMYSIQIAIVEMKRFHAIRVWVTNMEHGNFMQMKHMRIFRDWHGMTVEIELNFVLKSRVIS